MSYQWDVFISYKRDYQDEIDESSLALRKQWLKETFLPYFSLALSGEIGRQPKIFWDARLQIGDLFEDKLIEALSGSKCMVAILSNPYLYDSEWCLREFCFMKKRYETSRESYPNTFIYPILYQKTDIGHPLIKGMEFSDYTRYNKVGKAFIDSPAFLQFQTDIDNTVPTIAKVIQNPPDWKPGWTLKPWLEEIEAMVKNNRLVMNAPKMESKNIQM